MQTEISIIRYYQKHLKADEVLATKEYQLKKLMDILGLIAKIKDRIVNIQETSKLFYGINENGKIKTTQKEADKYIMYGEMLKRVKEYYNNQLSNLKKI